MVGLDEAKRTVFIYGREHGRVGRSETDSIHPRVGNMVGLEDAKNQTVCIHVVNGRIQVDSFHPFWGLEETKQFLSIHTSVHPSIQGPA
jgi:hypothetical protein